jgi:hypothetical protein
VKKICNLFADFARIAHSIEGYHGIERIRQFVNLSDGSSDVADCEAVVGCPCCFFVRLFMMKRDEVSHDLIVNIAKIASLTFCDL